MVSAPSHDLQPRSIVTCSMIRSKQELTWYLEADRIALGSPSGIIQWVTNDIWRFQRTLRRVEYELNVGRNPLRTLVARLLLRRRGTRLGFTIPPNVFGPGLSIAHHGTIVVNGGARVGANCRLHVCVSIGTQAGASDAAPTIGDNCYIGPGAKLFGPITIGPNVAIGANAVVATGFPEGGVTLGGVPARIISHSGSAGLLIRGSEHNSAESDRGARVRDAVGAVTNVRHVPIRFLKSSRSSPRTRERFPRR
jgi:serine O-acetyltransferase